MDKRDVISLSSHDTSITSETTVSSHDESRMSKVSKKQKILAKISIRRDKSKQKVLQKRQENLLSMADFFSKQEEFKLWMFEQKNKNVNSMAVAQQKSYFKKFIKLWNKRKLPQKYQHGPQTPPSTRKQRFSLIDGPTIHTPDILDFREPVDLSLANTPATPMSTFGKSEKNPVRDDGSSETPKRPPLSEVTYTPLDQTTQTSKGGLTSLRKSIFDHMTITSPINKYTNQSQQNREAAVISEGQTRWKDLHLVSQSEHLKDLEAELGVFDFPNDPTDFKSNDLDLQDMEGSPYSMMRPKVEAAVREEVSARRRDAKPEARVKEVNSEVRDEVKSAESTGIIPEAKVSAETKLKNSPEPKNSTESKNNPELKPKVNASLEIELLDQSHSPYSRMRGAMQDSPLANRNDQHEFASGMYEPIYSSPYTEIKFGSKDDLDENHAGSDNSLDRNETNDDSIYENEADISGVESMRNCETKLDGKFLKRKLESSLDNVDTNETYDIYVDDTIVDNCLDASDNSKKFQEITIKQQKISEDAEECVVDCPDNEGFPEKGHVDCSDSFEDVREKGHVDCSDSFEDVWEKEGKDTEVEVVPQKGQSSSVGTEWIVSTASPTLI